MFISRTVVAVGFDVLKKHCINHSILKTTVKKLKKAGVNPSEIIAITGCKDQQALMDYDELDIDDYQRIGKVLSYDKNTQLIISCK